MLPTHVASPIRSQQFLDVLSGYDSLLIVTHDNPDPDAIASAWAVSELVTQKLAGPVRTVAGGGIVRAENRHMVELLQTTLRGICGGGHTHRAGGKIPGVGGGSVVSEQWQRELRSRWLAACGVHGKRRRRLVARHEIINHL